MAVVAKPAKHSPFDLVTDVNLEPDEQTDYNNILSDPVWYEQTKDKKGGPTPYPYIDPSNYGCLDGSAQPFANHRCSSQIDQVYCDVPVSLGRKLICGVCVLEGKSLLSGHVNWAPATYAGTIEWEKAGHYLNLPPFGDGDSDFILYVDNRPGLTKSNCDQRKGALGIEFDSQEISALIKSGDQDFWWQQYAKETRLIFMQNLEMGAEKGQETFAVKTNPILDTIQGKSAIVTGLMGLDCEHGCDAELHPVYALAIRLKDGELSSDGTIEDEWILFVRNWGNEGFCSGRRKQYLMLADNQYTFALPWRKTAYRVQVGNGSRYLPVGYKEAQKPSVEYYHNEKDGGAKSAVFVTFTLPAPAKRGFLVAELHLKWPGVAPAEIKKPLVPVEGCGELADVFGCAEEKIYLIGKEAIRLAYRKGNPNTKYLDLLKEQVNLKLRATELRPQTAKEPPLADFPDAKPRGEPVTKPKSSPTVGPAPNTDVADRKDSKLDNDFVRMLCTEYATAQQDARAKNGLVRSDGETMLRLFQNLGINKICKMNSK